MYKKKKTLKTFLDQSVYNDELFSRDSLNTIIRALLEPVANQNTVSLMFSRLKNKDGLQGLIKRLEYCANVDMVDVLEPGVLKKDDYIELEFIIFTSSRYNFALIWDYSEDADKKYTKAFFIANSRGVNDVFEVLQLNMGADYKEEFYGHRPERRENELLNQALFNVFKKLNNSIEENSFNNKEDLIDLSSEDSKLEERIKTISHEIKNQISILDIYTKLIEKQTNTSKYTEAIKRACSIILLQLSELKNFETLNLREIILQDIISTSVSIFENILVENNNKIIFENNETFDIKTIIDENRLLSVFGNIIKNANESTKNDKITIKLHTKQNEAYIDITNHGEEIKNKEEIFNKGFTTKPNGSGIGLWASRAYIESFGGKLELLVSNKTETTFRITLFLN